MSNEDVEEIIGEIASKHRIVLSKDDPLMLVYTMNEYLLKKTMDSMDELYTKHLSELEMLFSRIENENMNKTQRLLTATVNAHRQAMAECSEKYTEKISDKLYSGISPVLSSCGSALKKAKTAATFNVVASVITFLSICTFVIIFWKFY